MERMVNFNRFPSNGAQSYVTADNIVNDSWSKMPAFSALIGGPAWGVVEPTGKGIEEHINKLHQLDRPRSEAAHAHVDTIVKDASTADKLKVCCWSLMCQGYGPGNTWRLHRLSSFYFLFFSLKSEVLITIAG
jgi:hypothetical protein